MDATEKRRLRLEFTDAILDALVATGAPRNQCAEGAVIAAWRIVDLIEEREVQQKTRRE